MGVGPASRDDNVLGSILVSHVGKLPCSVDLQVMF